MPLSQSNTSQHTSMNWMMMLVYHTVCRHSRNFVQDAVNSRKMKRIKIIKRAKSNLIPTSSLCIEKKERETRRLQKRGENQSRKIRMNKKEKSSSLPKNLALVHHQKEKKG